jgi:uncharacterized protein involved in type VI secretion and phage assembly
VMDLSLLRGALSPPSSRVYGVTVGLVTNNQDPDGLGRVKVKLPWLTDLDESYWARVVTPMAGNNRGLYFLPEVNDEVLVAFDHGQVEFPYVIGALWNGRDKPPESNSDGKNNMRTIQSRSGHIFRLDDTDGKEKIQIIDSTGKNSIVIGPNNTITIQADGDITIQSSSGKLKLSGNGIEITSQGAIKIQAQQDMNLTANGNAIVKGSQINLN